MKNPKNPKVCNGCDALKSEGVCRSSQKGTHWATYYEAALAVAGQVGQ